MQPNNSTLITLQQFVTNEYNSPYDKLSLLWYETQYILDNMHLPLLLSIIPKSKTQNVYFTRLCYE